MEEVVNVLIKDSNGVPTKDPIDVAMLGDLFWIRVFQYLDLRNQLCLASINNYFESLFKTPILFKRFEHIDASMTNMLNDNEMKQLFAKVGSRVISYSGSMIPKDDSEQHVWLLRLYCPKLRILKLLIKRNICNTLFDLNNIEELHMRLHFGTMTRNELNHLEKKLPNLKRLNLEAAIYPGTDLSHLNFLESLEIGYFPGFDAMCLEDCCTSMIQLRHLNIGHRINQLTSRHFMSIQKNCTELERLAFGIYNLRANVEYEIVCQLPKLKHLLLWINGSVRTEFLLGLKQKLQTPHPLLSLIFVGSQLPEQEIKLICQITSLMELDVACDVAHIQHLFKLRNLKYLHITIPEITNILLLHLIQNLPQLTVLNVRHCPLITNEFVSEVQQWLTQNDQARSNRIIIYIKGSLINFSQRNNTNRIKIINGSLEDPILFKSELI